MVSRRWLLSAGAAGLALPVTVFGGLAASSGPGGVFEVNHTDEEWRTMLTREQFAVLRKHGTERPFSSPLAAEHRSGLYVCAGCSQMLFSSEVKYDSGTGWPSFWEALEGGIATKDDWSLGMHRTEVHCRRCGGHLGHVFDDGPPPTGKRYCMNGVALVFQPRS